MELMMPAIQSVALTSTRLTILASGVSKAFLYTALTAAQNNPAAVEAAINTWLLANVPDCQARVHVFSMPPLVLTLGTWNLGASIDPNWWVDA